MYLLFSLELCDDPDLCAVLRSCVAAGDDDVSFPAAGSVLAKPRKTPKMVKPLVPPALCKRLDSEEDAEAKCRRFASEARAELMDIVPQERGRTESS